MLTASIIVDIETNKYQGRAVCRPASDSHLLNFPLYFTFFLSEVFQSTHHISITPLILPDSLMATNVGDTTLDNNHLGNANLGTQALSTNEPAGIQPLPMEIDDGQHTPAILPRASSALSHTSRASSVAEPPSQEELLRSLSDEKSQLVHCNRNRQITEVTSLVTRPQET